MLRTYCTCLGRLAAFGVALFLALPAPAWAQLSTSATIAGTVTDSTGAVVPQASITIINEATGERRTTESNKDGGFAVPGLGIGTYSVTVTKQGFQRYTEKGIVLHPAIVTAVNPALSVGSVVSEVTVSASAAQVQTSTHEISSEVSGQQVGTLPLNGRNYQSLAALMPGVTQLTPDTALSIGGGVVSNVVSVNGMGFTGTMYYLDGIWNMNSGSFAATTITPNPDSIQEVRVLQNNYGVQYNMLGANVVLLQTKGGTSTFHGTLFDYLRNDALDARNFFSPTVPALKQNIFGGSLGGPFCIPGHCSSSPKTFFFGTMEWEQVSHASVITAATPTAAMREGIFDYAITNPLTGQPFPEVAPGQYQIPQSMINPQALLLMNTLTSLPNNPSGGFLNYLNLTPATTPTRQDELKVERDFGSKLHLMAEYLDMRQTANSPGTPFTSTQYPVITQNQLAQIQLTATVSPSMVNTTSVSMNNYVVSLGLKGIGFLNQVPGFSEDLPFKGGFLSNRLPQISFASGWAGFGTQAPYPLNHAGDLDDTLGDDWSWLRGTHYIQAGGSIVLGGKKQNAFTSSNGSWFFSGQFTGDPIADYLLGDSATFFQQSTEQRPYTKYRIASPYIQDRWKATRRLSITAGLRVQFMPAPRAQRGILSAFNPALYNPAQAPIVNADGTITATPNYNPLNGVVINGVNGVPLNFTTAHQWYLAPSFGFAYDVFGDGKTALRGGYGITNAWVESSTDCSYSCGANPPQVGSISLIDAPFPNPIGAPVVPPSVESFGGGVAENSGFDLRASQVQTYSLSLEHQFPGNWFASIAGAGVVARHVQELWNTNQPLPDPPYDFNPIINTGTVFPYVYAPYLGYGLLLTHTNNDYAYWNALEISLRHPVGHNLFFNASYTWQHDLSNDVNAAMFQDWSGMQDIYHPGQNYGNTPNNVPQILSFSYIWTIPWGKDAPGWKGLALGGWQYAGMATIQSGFSLMPGISTATVGLATRADRVPGSSTGGPRTVQDWFNTAAFAAPAAGYFGNAAPGSIQGPGTVDFDMAFYKDFRIRERHTIEFRAELFNIFNHTNFSGVSTSFGTGNFGQITSALDPRIAEFALRYQF